ncbi:hypothetical protein RHGRI_004472 [Rhododendron griersonianum]|uniref:Flavodoxin-like domain-containing protein n=1 Tax=Rhododendron griersonianum TaxID=479676 RepID=A0AAV6L957_9ERIC|nr:hypothetical protein RHGRI_004472 [Rhododendron griersonianum]
MSHYSMYGHVATLAEEIKKGAASVEGVEAKLWQIDSHYSAHSPRHDLCANWLHIGARMFEMEKVKGGSPYGAGTYAGDGTRQPLELKLEQAFHWGKYIAGLAKKLKGSA